MSVLSVLCAAGCFTLIFQGCEKRSGETTATQEASTPSLCDPKLLKSLEETRQARNGLAGVRNRIVARMEAMIEAKKIELKTDDLAKIKVELEKDPEWNSLYKRCVDANTAIEENLRTAQKKVAAHMRAPAPVKEKISK